MDVTPPRGETTRTAEKSCTHVEMLKIINMETEGLPSDWLENSLRSLRALDACPLAGPPVRTGRGVGRLSRCNESLGWFPNMAAACQARDDGLIPHGSNVEGTWRSRKGGTTRCRKSVCARHSGCNVELHLKQRSGGRGVQAVSFLRTPCTVSILNMSGAAAVGLMSDAGWSIPLLG